MISCLAPVSVLAKNQDRTRYVSFKCSRRLKPGIGINHSKGTWTAELIVFMMGKFNHLLEEK